MTTATFLAIVVLGLLVLLGPRLVRRGRSAARRHVAVREGVLVMRAPRRYGIALGVCALIPAAILGSMTVRLAQGGLSGASLAGAGLATLACVAVAVHQFVAAFRQGFVVDQFGLARVGVFRTRRLRWADVAKVTYNPMNRWFFLTAADGWRLWIPVETHGIADFAGIALQRLPAAALRADELAREALDELVDSERAG